MKTYQHKLRALCSMLILLFAINNSSAEQWCGDAIIAKNTCTQGDVSWVVQMNLFSEDTTIVWGNNDCVSFEGCVTSAEWIWSNPGAWSQLLLSKEGFCAENNKISNTSSFNVSYDGGFSGGYGNHRLAIVSWGKTADNCDWTTDNLYELYLHEQSYNEGPHQDAYDWCIYKGTSPSCSGSTYELYDCEYQILGRSIRCWRNNPRTEGTTDVNCLWNAWRDLGIAPDVYYYFTEVGAEVGPSSGGTFNMASADMVRVANGDAINETYVPEQVSPGEEVTITVDYNATTNRDIQVVLQLNSDPYTNHGGNLASVSAGSGSVDITFTVDANTPLGNDSYHLQTFITTSGGGWDDRLDNLLKNNIDCVGATFSDDVIATTVPGSVSPGEEVTVSVEYEASTNRDLVVAFQKDSDPWTLYGTETVNVSAGNSTIDVVITIDTNTPIANDEYQFQTFLTTDGGGWDERLDNVNKNNINCVSGGSSVQAYYIKNKASGNYLRPANADDNANILVTANDNSDWFKWEKIATSDDYYYLKNVQTGKYFRPENNDDGVDTNPNGDNRGAPIIQRPTSFGGNWTQWKEELSGDGEYYFLINRALDKHIRPINGNASSNVELRPITWRGNWPRWAFEEVGGSSRTINTSDDNEKEYSPQLSINNDLIIIQGDELQEVIIYALNGKIMEQAEKLANRYELKTTDFSSGVYVLKSLSISGKSFSQKIIIR